MRQDTLQEQYNRIVEGKGDKVAFHRQALRQFPNLFTAQSSLDQVVTVLKQKQVISEVATEQPEQTNFFKSFRENIQMLAEAEAKGYDGTDKKSIDNKNGAEFLLGFYVESRNAKNVDKTVEQIRDIVIKNLAKDPLHYVKSGQFGVEGLGYTEDAPGLGKTKEVTGKYASSGMEPVKINESLEEADSVEDKIKSSFTHQVTGGKKGKPGLKEIDEEKKLTYNDFVQMVRDDMMAGAAPDERPSDKQVASLAKAYYNDYLRSKKGKPGLKEMTEEIFNALKEGNLGHNEKASLEKEGGFWIVTYRTMDGKKTKVFTDEDEARAFMDTTLEEGLPKGYWAKKIKGGMDESYETLVKKIKGQGKSEKAAKAIAGAVASYKAKGGGKGPTAKQSK